MQVFGLPDDTDLSFLQGKKLFQICLGQYETVFVFEDDIDITAFKNFFYHQSAFRGEVRECQSPLVKPPIELFGESIECSKHNSDGWLRIEFSNGDSLELIDVLDGYESYTIRYRDKLIVV